MWTPAEPCVRGARCGAMSESLPSRDAALVAMRPLVPTEPAFTPAEQFLHATLRPVLKLQNETLLALVARDVAAQEPGFGALAPPDQADRLRARLRTDSRLKRTLLGVVYGALTTDELACALGHDAEIRRRIAALVAERVASQAVDVARRVMSAR